MKKYITYPEGSLLSIIRPNSSMNPLKKGDVIYVDDHRDNIYRSYIYGHCLKDPHKLQFPIYKYQLAGMQPYDPNQEPEDDCL